MFCFSCNLSYITRLTRHDSVRGVSVTWYVWTCLNIAVQTGQLPHSTDAKKCQGTESGKPLGGSFMHKNSSDQAARCPAIANAISWLGVFALHWLFFRLPSGNWTGCYWQLPFTVDLPLKIVIFQFAMLVYQRVSERIIHRSCEIESNDAQSSGAWLLKHQWPGTSLDLSENRVTVNPRKFMVSSGSDSSMGLFANGKSANSMRYHHFQN